MTLFKSKVKPSDTNVNEKNDEKKDEKNYNSSIIPTDDDDCTITIIVPPTARPANSRYSVQYLKQMENAQQSHSENQLTERRFDAPNNFTRRYIVIITLVALKFAIIAGKYIIGLLLQIIILY
jgi:hypothetical protein